MCNGHLALTWTSELHAVLPEPDPARADAVLRAMAATAGEGLFLTSAAPGMVLAIVRGDQSVVAGFGETAIGSRAQPDGRTLVRVGSISKAFAGQLLAELASRRIVGLSDLIGAYLPAGMGSAAPTFNGRGITLLDLATHTAGLPYDLPFGCDGTQNPFDRLTPEVYHHWLCGQPSLPYPPGQVALYSNLSFALLGDMLARACAMRAPGGPATFGELLRQFIALPLGMGSTTVAPTPAERERMMTGYDGDGTPSPGWDCSAIMHASGGVFTTADDMVKWLKFYTADDASPMRGARELAVANYRPRQGLDALVGFDDIGPLGGFGLGWELTAAREDQPLIVQKTGAFSGIVAYVAFVPGRRTGLFFAANRLEPDALFATARAANRVLAGLATR